MASKPARSARAQGASTLGPSLAQQLNGRIDNAFAGVAGSFAPRFACVLPVLVLVYVMAGAALDIANKQTDIKKIFVDKDSRVVRESEFVDKYFTDSDSRLSYFFVRDGHHDGDNVATASRLGAMLAAHQDVYAHVRYTHRDRQTYGLQDLCVRPLNSYLNAIVTAGHLADPTKSKETPCIRTTPLDCFAEGAFEGETLPPLAKGLLYRGFAGKESFLAANITDHLNPARCASYAGVPISENLILGGVSRDAQGAITSVASMRTILRLLGPRPLAKLLKERDALRRDPLIERNCIRNSDPRTCSPTAVETCVIPRAMEAQTCIDNTVASRITPVTAADVEDARALLLGWEKAFDDFFATRRDAYSHARIDYFSGRSYRDIAERAGDEDVGLVIAGYIVMILFAAAVGVRRGTEQSRLGLSLAGIGLVILSVIGAMGAASSMGIYYTPTVIQVMPFLALGLGINDMFIYMYEYRFDFNTEVGARGRRMGVGCSGGASLARATHPARRTTHARSRWSSPAAPSGARARPAS